MNACFDVRRENCLGAPLVRGVVELPHVADVGVRHGGGTFTVVDALVRDLEDRQFGGRGDPARCVNRFSLGVEAVHFGHHESVSVGEQDELLAPPGQPFLWFDEGDLPHGAYEHSGFPVDLIADGVYVDESVIGP